MLSPRRSIDDSPHPISIARRAARGPAAQAGRWRRLKTDSIPFVLGHIGRQVGDPAQVWHSILVDGNVKMVLNLRGSHRPGRGSRSPGPRPAANLASIGTRGGILADSRTIPATSSIKLAWLGGRRHGVVLLRTRALFVPPNPNAAVKTTSSRAGRASLRHVIEVELRVGQEVDRGRDELLAQGSHRHGRLDGRGRTQAMAQRPLIELIGSRPADVTEDILEHLGLDPVVELVLVPWAL